MTVTISKRAVQAFGQNGDNCRQFLQSKQNDSYGSYTVEDVGETFRLTGSYESIRHIRKELTEKMLAATAGDQRQPQANSTQKVGDDVGGVDVRATPFTSHKTPQGVVDKHSQTTEGQLSSEVTMQEPSQKPKRVRRLKSPTPEGHTSEETAAQEGLAERKVDDGRVLDEETRKLIKRGDYVSIEVDRDRHHYLLTHFEDELKKQLPPFHAFEDDEGKYKVAIALNSKNKDQKAITHKFNSYLNRFSCAIGRVPDGVDGSVLRSLVTTEVKDSTFILDENDKIYKLIGEKNKVTRMKKLIDEYLSEQQKPSKDSEGTWQEVLHAKRKVKRASSTLSYYMEHGKLIQRESSQLPAAKNFLQVSMFESNSMKTHATETIVRAVDCKMQRFGDSKPAIEFESNKKYKDECRRISNEHHNSIPVGTVMHIPTTGDLLQKTKIKYIVHVVLEEKKVPVASDDVMKDIIYRCLYHAETALQTKSVTLPHLGGSDYCHIGSFVRGSVAALQQLTSSNQHIQRVCFVVKDSKTLQELAGEFESCVDH